MPRPAGFHHPESTRAKIGERNRGKVMSPEAREKIRQYRLGRKHSQETIEKIREKNRNKVISEEARERIREANRNKVYSEASLKKMSETKKKTWIVEKENGERFEVRGIKEWSVENNVNIQNLYTNRADRKDRYFKGYKLIRLVTNEETQDSES